MPLRPPVIALVQNRRTALMAREAEAFEALTREWRRLEDAIESDLEVVARDIAEMQVDNRRIDALALLGLASFTRLLARLREAGRRFGQNAAGLIRQDQAAFIRAGLTDAADALALYDVAVSPLPPSLSGVTPGLASNGATIESLTATSWEVGARNLLSRAIELGVRGLAASALLTGLRDALALGLQHTLTVTRSETWTAYRGAQDAQYRDSGVVRAYRRLSRRDANTCIGCLAADGWIYPEGDDFESHPNCRCVKVPILVGREAPEYPTGAEWLASQTDARQRAILGPGRYRLYKQGKPFGDFAKVSFEGGHYTSVRPTPIYELERYP